MAKRVREVVMQVTEAANAPAPVAAPAAAPTSAPDLEKRLARVRRQKADVERELADIGEAKEHARQVAKTAAVRAVVNDTPEDAKAAADAQELLGQTIERETALRHELEPLTSAEAQLNTELERAQKAAHTARRERVMARLAAGTADVREQLLEALVLAGLELQLKAGMPPASATQICSWALGERLAGIGATIEKRFWTMWATVEAEEAQHVA